MTPYVDQEGMLSLRSCLVDAKRKLLFMVEQVFLPAGGGWGDWSMPEADTQCTGLGVGEVGREECICKFLLSCHKI